MVRTPPFQGENPGSNPSGAAKITKPHFCGFFVRFLIHARVRKLDIENRDRFTHLRTFKKKRLEI